MKSVHANISLCETIACCVLYGIAQMSRHLMVQIVTVVTLSHGTDCHGCHAGHSENRGPLFVWPIGGVMERWRDDR